jgi:hypothetical protein
MLEKSVMLMGSENKVQKRSLMNTLMQLRKIVIVLLFVLASRVTRHRK